MKRIIEQSKCALEEPLLEAFNKAYLTYIDSESGELMVDNSVTYNNQPVIVVEILSNLVLVHLIIFEQASNYDYTIYLITNLFGDYALLDAKACIKNIERPEVAVLSLHDSVPVLASNREESERDMLHQMLAMTVGILEYVVEALR